MSDESFDTLQMQQCVGRWRAGDTAAADILLRRVGDRLEHMTRKMLGNFPNVRASAETGDVLQGGLLRLLNTLRRIEPESTRHFFNLAALQVRRELIDLARHFRRPTFLKPAAAGNNAAESGAEPVADAEASRADHDLDLWCQFHEAVDKLPTEEREVVGLAFYHGWTQPQIAELFQVDERTVRRRWQSACLRLHELVGDRLPSP